MPNFLKTYSITIAICVVISLIATGAAVYFVKQAAQTSKAASIKLAEELKASETALGKSNTEVASLKGALDKETALNAELKKSMADSDTELQQLRGSLKAATMASAKLANSRIAKTRSSSSCRESTSKSSKDRLSALQKLEADLHRRENELKERQRKLDETVNKLAAEKRKLLLQNSEYRWPHPPEQGNKPQIQQP